MAVGGREVGGEWCARWFAATVAVRLDNLLDVVSLVYVDDARRGVNLETGVVVASLCEREASLQPLADARFEDHRSGEEEIVDVGEDDADHANAVDDSAKHEHAAIERRDVEWECDEEEGIKRVIPAASCARRAVRVIGDS